MRKHKKNKKAAIIGGFTVDFWAIIAIFLIIAFYIAFSFILTSLRGGGKIIIDTQSEQSKILTNLGKIDYYLDAFIYYKKDFRNNKRDIYFVVDDFSEEIDLKDNFNANEYLNFFSELKIIPYLEMSKDNKFIYCVFGNCKFENPRSDKTIEKLSNAEREVVFQFYIKDVFITICNTNLNFVSYTLNKSPSPLDLYLGGMT